MPSPISPVSLLNSYKNPPHRKYRPSGENRIKPIASSAHSSGIAVFIGSEIPFSVTKKRLKVYGLSAQDIRVGDAEDICYSDNTFDLVYSFGVIHHSPDTVKAFKEVIRVTKPGGLCKIMIYNKHSLAALYLWIKFSLLKGHPKRTIYWNFFHHMENVGTKSLSSS